MTAWLIEPFAKKHYRSGFSCGQSSLDEFLQTRVNQYQRRNLGQTFVAVPQVDDVNHHQVIGYYTLAASAVAFQNLPLVRSRRLPKHPVPVVLLGRLAVDRAHQGKGLGEGLLLDALQRTQAIATELGIYAVEVDAIDDSTAAFYTRYGFAPLLDQPRHLFLPIETIDRAIGTGS